MTIKYVKGVNKMQTIKNNFLGVLLCLAIAIPSYILGSFFPIVGGAVFAIIIGMIVTCFYKNKTKTQSGITYTSKKILSYAVILLGFGLNLSQVAQVGLTSLPIIISTIATSLIVAFIMHKILKMDTNISTLIGVGSSICGGSAIAATAPVIEAEDEEISQSIAVIFLFNILAALIFPSLGQLLGLSNEGFGLFAGTAINDTSSVTAAASTWDTIHKNANTLDFATIVKLTRTLAIIPITLVLAFMQIRKKKRNAQTSDTKSTFNLKKIFPFFIIFFLLASVITTVCVSMGVSMTVFSPLKDLSKFFIIMAMSAIGLNTNIVKIVKTGGKAIIMGFTCWVSISVVSLCMQHLLKIW